MTSKVQLVAGLTGFEGLSGDVRLSGERLVRLEVPETFGREHVDLMQRDLEVMAGIAKRYPDELVKLENAVLRHDFASAAKLANEIGLTEDQIVAQGGAKWGSIAVGVGIVLVFGLLLESDSPHPPAPEETGPGDAGAGNAGPG